VKTPANPSVNRTPCQLRWQVPSGLRPPVAGYVERSSVIARQARDAAPLVRALPALEPAGNEFPALRG